MPGAARTSRCWVLQALRRIYPHASGNIESSLGAWQSNGIASTHIPSRVVGQNRYIQARTRHPDRDSVGVPYRGSGLSGSGGAGPLRALARPGRGRQVADYGRLIRLALHYLYTNRTLIFTEHVISHTLESCTHWIPRGGASVPVRSHGNVARPRVEVHKQHKTKTTS